MPLDEIVPSGKLLATPTTTSNGDDARLLNVGTAPGDSLLVTPTNTDAFQRTRVSNPATVADCAVIYDKAPLHMDEATTGAGVAIHSPNDASVIMSVGTASGDNVIRQSRQYCTYQKGKSQLALVTGTLCAPIEGRVSGMGYGDGEDGVFLVQRETGPAILFRSSVSGSIVDTYIDQADWNKSTVPGLDLSKSQIFVVDLQWLGVGRVRVGLDRDGEIVLLHEFFNDNRNIATYWRTATLPARYWIENIATTAEAGSMRQICWSVQSEGAFEIDRGLAWSSGRYASKSVGTAAALPVFSIRPKTTFNGITNRVGILPRAFEIAAEQNGVFVEVIHDGALTGASWSDVDTTHSSVEYDESATAVTGGTVVWSGLVGSSGPKTATISEGGPPVLIWLTNSIDGTTTTPLTIRARSLASSASVRCVVRWNEIR